MEKSKKIKGFSLVEVVIGSAIIFLVVMGIVVTSNYFLKLALANVPKVKSSFLLEEGIEAVKFLRDKSYILNIQSLSTSTPYYLVFDGYWKATTTPNYIDGFFERTFVLEDVYRDVDKVIVSTPGTLDPKSRFITVSVSWFNNNATTTRTMSTYITDILFN